MNLEHFRSLLKRRAGELAAVTESGSEQAKVVELDQQRVGRLSRMDALQAQAMSQETNRRRELELQKISAALARIDNDEYGICLVCGDEIHEQRLEVDPATTVCINCAE